jgi:hypothetical protein
MRCIVIPMQRQLIQQNWGTASLPEIWEILNKISEYKFLLDVLQKTFSKIFSLIFLNPDELPLFLCYQFHIILLKHNYSAATCNNQDFICQF